MTGQQRLDALASLEVEVPELPPVPPTRPVADRLLQQGQQVERRFVDSHFDRSRRDERPLSEFVAEALQAAERTGEERADARYSALLDRIAGVVLQRQQLAAEQEQHAARLGENLDDPSSPRVAWANALRGQVDAIRSTLDPAEQAEVAGRVERLREQQS